MFFFFYSQAMVRAGKQHLPRVVATICEVNFGPDIKYIELVFVVWPEFVCLEALFQAILLKAFRPFFSLQWRLVQAFRDGANLSGSSINGFNDDGRLASLPFSKDDSCNYITKISQTKGRYKESSTTRYVILFKERWMEISVNVRRSISSSKSVKVFWGHEEPLVGLKLKSSPFRAWSNVKPPNSISGIKSTSVHGAFVTIT